MPIEESIICRKKLDEARGGDWVCECPLCMETKRESLEEEKGAVLKEKGSFQGNGGMEFLFKGPLFES